MSNSGDQRSFNIEEVERLVDNAVDEWEISRIVMSRDSFPWGWPNEREIPGAEVSEEARRALTEPVLTHWDHIKQELAEEKIDERDLVRDLRHGVSMVLMEAAQLALQEKVEKLLEELSLAELDEATEPEQLKIEEATVREVLKIDEDTARYVVKTRCPYLFWC